MTVSRPTRRRRLLLFVGGVLAALLLAEGTVRVLGLPRKPAFQFLGPVLDLERVFVEDPLLFWRLDPQTPHFVANRLGLRGWLPRGDKRAGNLRIACVGDSCTFGFGVRYEESYGVVLEQLLQARYPGTRVESILAGLPCYSTLQNRVQFEREIAPLQPDVTVFYCGAWNDFTPAVGLTDAERLARNERRARNPLWRLRLMQLAARAFGDEAPKTADSERDLVARVPHGLRVSREEYADNLRALIGAARAIRSTVVVVLPPHPAKTERERPIALEYRALTRDIATAAGVAILDAPALLRDREPLAADDVYGRWFDDWVHPSIAGHRAIAEALFASVADRLTVEADRPLTLRTIEPKELELFVGEGLAFSLDADQTVERVWLGSSWLRDVVRTGDRVRVGLGELCETGPLTLRVTTGAGVASDTVRVVPPRVHVETTRDDAGLRVTASGRGPPGWYVGVWVADALRDEPVRTAWGPFRLAGSGGEPFAFERLELTRLAGKIGADGRWQLGRGVDVGSPTLHVQGLLIREDDRRRGITTQVTTVAAPR